MHETTNRSAAVGKVARVEICGCGGSLIVALGSLSLRLDRETAADLAATLEVALSMVEAGDAQAREHADGSNPDGTN